MIIIDRNIFFDFKDPVYCGHDGNDINTCKIPLIKNTGKTIDIIDDCGVMVMHPHLNGYKCYKIELHSPSEHKISI